MSQPSTTGRRYAVRPTDERRQVDLLKGYGWLLGGWLIVWSLVALARAGFDDFDLFDPTVTVATLHATRLWALILLAVGLIIWAGIVGQADDLGLRVLGALLFVFGLVFMIEPGGFERWLATETRDGLHLAVIGAALVVLSLIPPIRLGRAPRDDAES